MQLEHGDWDKLKKQIAAIVAMHALDQVDLTKYRLFAFGSRVSGKSNSKSDIDIGIEGPEKLPFDMYLDIRASLRDGLPIKVDFVDFKRVSERFRQVALQSTESVNVKVLFKEDGKSE